MNYIDEIFARANIQCIRGFLQCGADCAIDRESYQARIKRAHGELTAHLREHLPEEAEFETVMTHICDSECVIENVFMEIGLQVGVMLAAQVYGNQK